MVSNVENIYGAKLDLANSVVLEFWMSMKKVLLARTAPSMKTERTRQKEFGRVLLNGSMQVLSEGSWGRALFNWLKYFLAITINYLHLSDRLWQHTRIGVYRGILLQFLDIPGITWPEIMSLFSFQQQQKEQQNVNFVSSSSSLHVHSYRFLDNYLYFASLAI